MKVTLSRIVRCSLIVTGDVASSKHMINSEYKRMFAEALATISWVNEVGQAKGANMLETIQTVPQVLQLRIDTARQQLELQATQQQTILQILPQDATEDDIEAQLTTAVMLNDHTMTMTMNEKLWPLVTAQSLREEMLVLVALSKVIVLSEV